MSLAAQFWQNVEECRRLTGMMSTDEQRQALLKMAALWEDLARDAEAKEGAHQPAEKDGAPTE